MTTSKMKTTSKNEDDLKNEDDIKNEDDLKIYFILYWRIGLLPQRCED